jgi:hypothetical protein
MRHNNTQFCNNKNLFAPNQIETILEAADSNHDGKVCFCASSMSTVHPICFLNFLVFERMQVNFEEFLDIIARPV